MNLQLPVTAFITNTLLSNIINFLAPVVGIALVIFCLMQGIGIAKGNDNGGVKKLVTGVLLILFILGVMYAAGSFDTYGQAFKNVTDSAITSAGNDAGSLINGGAE